MVNNQNFELIFNIDANKKYYFGDLVLKLPTDFEKNNLKNKILDLRYQNGFSVTQI